MTAAERALTEAAPAKVNLYLHLRGRRADGHHNLDSLAVFPAIADRLTGGPGQGLSLEIGGPFGAGLAAESDNLVLRAARALAGAHGVAPDAALRLEKHLPVASGIGGGSSDAAAALRLLSRLWGVAIPDGLALGLGADVPVCLGAPLPRCMAGIGELLAPAPAMPEFWMVLANPQVAVATGAVFAAVEQRENPSGPPPPPLPDFAALTGWLARQRNDLQPAAVSACPAIAEVLAALDDAPLVRMSGSGATCFALHGGEADAVAQAERLRRSRPGWWVVAAPVAPAVSRP
ncbi:MAG: 4-(cytidine 5'-diphospho)-2-C-methyl-D-erythritol kinase [Alphaproteobacteria bacterium]